MKDRLLRFWFADTDSRIYAAFRMGFAAVALLNLLQLAPFRHVFFADTGLVDLRAAHAPGHFGVPHFSLFNVFTSESQVDAVFAISAVALILLAAGILARTAALWVFIWHLTITYRSPVAMGGWDDILRVYGFLLLISPLGPRWPWPRRGTTRTNAGTSVSPAPVYGLQLMRLQLLVIYVHSAICKLPDADWLNGDVLTYYLLSTNARFPAMAILDMQPVLKAMTWAVLAGEILVPALLLFRKSRIWGVLLGITFHAGIFLLSRNLGLFCATMLILYIPFLDTAALSWPGLRRRQLREWLRRRAADPAGN